jgi:hypothetical protein
MQASRTLLVNSSNRNAITNHRKLSYIKVPFAQTFMPDSLTLILKPSEDNIKCQWNDRRTY